MIGRLMFMGLLVVFVALAVMFDWFGARDWVTQTLSFTEHTVEELSDKGDAIKEFIDLQKTK